VEADPSERDPRADDQPRASVLGLPQDERPGAVAEPRPDPVFHYPLDAGIVVGEDEMLGRLERADREPLLPDA
jgi:hypothetical protein